MGFFVLQSFTCNFFLIPCGGPEEESPLHYYLFRDFPAELFFHPTLGVGIETYIFSSIADRVKLFKKHFPAPVSHEKL